MLGKLHKGRVLESKGCVSLTRDCPDGFLHLRRVLGDVINDDVTLQQSHEKVFPRDGLKKRIDDHSFKKLTR